MNETDAGAESDKRGRGVGGRDGDALRAARSDATDVAVLFHAVTERFAPIEVLVVVVAARVEADVAADRTHVAKLWCRDHGGGLGQRGVPGLHDPALGDVGQRGERADLKSGAFVEADVAQTGDRAQADQHLGREETLLHVGVKIGAARDDQCIRHRLFHDRDDEQ